MKFIETVFQKLRRHPKRIVFPDGTDSRVLLAARKFVSAKLGPAIVLGHRAEIDRVAEEEKIDLSGIGIIDPSTSAELPLFCERLEKLRRYRDLGRSGSEEIMKKPAYFAAMMIQYGLADALVGGAQGYPGSLFRPLLQLVKPLPGIETISSCMILDLHNKELTPSDVLLFADCAVIPEPSVEQLAAIAVETGTICRQLTGAPPRVALISFSTKGSAKMPVTERIAAAAALAKRKSSEQRIAMEIDGELQVDSALIRAVGAQKAPNSTVAGRANVLVFPDLNSGNVAAKLMSFLSGAETYGQILLGLSRPCGNVSRAATVDEIMGVAAIAGLQAIEYRNLYPKEAPAETPES